MNLQELLLKTLTNVKIISAVFSTLSIMLLGFYLRKKEFFSGEFAKNLSKVVLFIALPCLAFKSFMSPLDKETLTQGINVFAWGFIAHLLIFVLSIPMYLFYKNRDKREVFEVLTSFGSTVYFGIPIVEAVFGSEGVMYSSLFNVGFYLLLYSYAYIRISKTEITLNSLKNVIFSPVILLTIAGFLIWISQTIAPQTTIIKNGESYNYSLFRIDETLPWFYAPISFLGTIASPLAWLAAGITLGEISFKNAVLDPSSWYYSFNKIILYPLISLFILITLTATGILHFNSVALSTIVILVACPASTVVTSYCINFNRYPVPASNATLISSALSGILIPLWVIILEIVKNTGLY